MSRGDRGEFVALVAVVCTVVVFVIGLWSGAYYQRQYGAHEKYEAARGIDTTDTESFWHNHTPALGGYEAICDHPSDKDQADLCQQWRSATAAEEVASYTWLGLFFNVVGLLGLGGTVWLARNSILETRILGQAQVRAYLMLEQTSIEWGEIVTVRSQHTALFSTRWENRGNSPALACNLSTRVYPVRPEDVGMPIPEAGHRFEKLDFGHTDISGSGDGAWAPAPQPLDEKQVKAWIAGKLAIVVHSCVMYRDVFGKPVKIQACSQAHYLKREEGKSRVQFSTYAHHNRYEI